uniref:Uncharacterized protein n=1 Tax=Thermodesulfobacterium geofontis TaxID=1295609 RepID=A0A7C4NR17_9BACT
MARYFLGDNLNYIGKPDRDKIHWGEPWERSLVKARKYKGKDTFDKRTRTIVLVYTKYGTFAVRKTYFEKYKKRILATARGYRVIEIKKDGIKKEPIKTVQIKPIQISPKKSLLKGKSFTEVAVINRLKKRAKDFGLPDLDVLSMDIKSLVDPSLSVSENLKNIEKYLFGSTQKDVLSLRYEFDRKAQEEYLKYLQDPEKWLENIKYQERKLKELLGYG